jgi:glutamine amidotransferase
MRRIQILDYGSGNLFSIENALRRESDSIEVIVSSDFLRSADALILPGVGSFSSAQKVLSLNKDAILNALSSDNIPLLGICLGMQLLFEESEEGPGEGLKLFGGKVKRFGDNTKLKIPHMGWNTIELQLPKSRICQGLSSGAWVYYVHSYFPVPVDHEYVTAWTDYGSERFPALVEKGNIFGTQFHPEKSQLTGSTIISNFVSFVRRN